MGCTWVVENYVGLVVVILFVALMGRFHWEEHKAYKEREEWRELCNLRDVYDPGRTKKEEEKRRLAYLEEKLKR